MDSKKILYRLVISIFIFGAGFFIASLLSPGELPKTLYFSSSSNIDKDYLMSEKNRLVGEIESLKNENARLKNRLSSNENKDASQSAAHQEQVSPSLENNKSVEEILFARQVEKFSADFEARLLKRMQSGPNYNYSKDMAEQFTNEPVDASWASSHEMELQSLLRTHEKLNHLTPESIQCKTGQCRIRIPIANIEEANNIGLAFIAAASGLNTTEEQKTSTAIDMERSVIDVYFAKGGEPAPF